MTTTIGAQLERRCRQIAKASDATYDDVARQMQELIMESNKRPTDVADRLWWLVQKRGTLSAAVTDFYGVHDDMPQTHGYL